MLCLLFLVAVLSSVADCRGPGGTCTGRCFTYDPYASCQCDEACTSAIDCCSDYTTVCPKPGCESTTCLNGGECEVDPKTSKAKCKCPKGFGDLQCSNPRCTRYGRVCTQEASCDKQKCSCPNKGWGIFECARQNQLLCAVKLDPHATSFGGAVANVYWPCRYRLTRLTTQVLDPAGTSPASKPNFCFIEVLAFNQISPKSGKHFVSGVEIAVSINIGSQGAFSAQTTIAKFDLFGDGVAGNKNSGVRFNTVGTGSHPSFHNVTIDCVHDPVQNFAVLSIPRCQNFQLKFRPYNHHEDPGAQSMAPGVSIRVDNPHYSHHASHSSSHHVYGTDFSNPLAQYPNALCGTKDDGNTLFKVPGWTNAQNLLFGLLQQQQVDQVSTFIQNPEFHLLDVVDHPDECAVAKETIAKCDNEEERRFTIAICSDLLSNRRYTRCTGSLAMITFRYCLEAFCNNDVADRCAEIAILASSNGCTAKIPSQVRVACGI